MEKKLELKNPVILENNDDKTVLIGNMKTGYSYITPKEAEEIRIKNDRKMIEDFQDTLTKMFLYSEHNNIMLRNKSVEITKVIFNNPATIVFWSDGKKTVVKCAIDEAFDEEKGFAMAISKRVLGNKGNYYNEFKKWLPKIEVCEDNSVKAIGNAAQFECSTCVHLETHMNESPCNKCNYRFNKYKS